MLGIKNLGSIRWVLYIVFLHFIAFLRTIPFLLFVYLQHLIIFVFLASGR